MLKLVKYEFRKKRAALMVIFAIIAALEVYFLGSLAAEKEEHMIASFAMIAFAGFGLAIAVFVMGVSSYSKELKQKSSYLIFMTPNSTLGIVGSKFLFTFFLGLLSAALMACLAIIDYPLLADYFGTFEGLFFTFDMMLAQGGLSLNGILFQALFFVLLFFLETLAIVGVAYFSITLSSTFLQNKKGKGVVSVALFLLIAYGLNRLSSLWLKETTFYVESFGEVIGQLTPMLLQDAAVLLLSLFGCAWMLDRRVSL